MNNNYHYIIAGLPDIAPDMNGSAPTYESLVAVIKEQLSERDLRLVDWLEYGFDEAHLTDHFYHSVQKTLLKKLKKKLETEKFYLLYLVE